MKTRQSSEKVSLFLMNEQWSALQRLPDSGKLNIGDQQAAMALTALMRPGHQAISLVSMHLQSVVMSSEEI
jgi:hypothetical protein